jgi:hypothetical protein
MKGLSIFKFLLLTVVLINGNITLTDKGLTNPVFYLNKRTGYYYINLI